MFTLVSMNSIHFASVITAINAYRALRANGLYCVLDGKSIKFETSEDAEVAEAILPSYRIVSV